jgi:hypothetical protein
MRKRFGIKTGINEFFYLKPIQKNKENKTFLCENSRGWQGEIESKYLKQIIKSPKESDSIIIDPKKLKNLIFICNKSKAELKKANHLNALKYIEWGETQRTKENKPWTDVPSVQGRKYWWGIETKNAPTIYWTEMYFTSFRTLISLDEILESDKFYRIEPFEKNPKLGIFLNSSLIAMHRELVSFMSLGDGVLKTPVYEISNLSILKDFDSFEFQNPKFINREIKPIFDDLKKKDRIELDKAVLKALGLNSDEYLSRIYEGLTQMVKERLELPKMRKKRKRQKVQTSYEEVKKSVINEIIDNKIKKFPEDFYTDAKLGRDYESVETEVYNTSGKELHIDEFINICTLIDEDGEEIFSTKDFNKAEFAVIFAKLDVYRLKIPKDEKITKSILDNYKNYVNQLKEQLEANAQQKLHSWNEAEQMAKEILEEYGMLILW